MPSKKKKYNARFPAGRIKKIMQTDEEVGKVAQAVPVIISRTLELFVESLLTKSMQITQARNAKTLTPSHMKQCILSESRFDFLKDLVKDIPDASSQDDSENVSSEVLDYTVPKNSEEEAPSSPPNALKIEVVKADQQPEEIVANFYTEQSTSASRTPVIQYGPKLLKTDPSKLSFSVENLVKPSPPLEPKIHLDLSHLNNISSENVPAAVPPVPVPEPVQTTKSNKANSPPSSNNNSSNKESASDNIPPLVPISRSYYGPNTGGNLYIDEDYDN